MKRLGLVVLGAALGLGLPSSSLAAIFGVPTNLGASGAPTASSVNPPGWFILDGTASAAADGDTVHQLRVFIEVTGTTLDVRVFDPGNSGARDLARGGTSQTTYTLFNPAGVALSTVAIDNDSGTTNNSLVRFTPGSNGFFALGSGNPSNVSFSGLSPGLYEFQATMTNGSDDVNAFGLDIRVSKTDATHYNAYTIGRSADPDTAMMVGALNSGGTPFANITQRMVFFPYVNRGCTVETSNFDMDTGTGNAGQNSAGDITDTQAAVSALTMSGLTAHSENTITVEDVTATNLESINYGMWTLTNHTGTQQNLIDWRVSDFSGSVNLGPAVPVDPVSAIRMYLPNGYTPPIPPNTSATAPLEPIFAISARVVSGANPPAVGMTTRFLITATVDNPTSSALTNVQITIGQPANVIYVAGSQAGFIDGAAAACTDGSGLTFRRCTFASLAAGSVASLNIEVDFLPLVSGLNNLTGPPLAGSPPPDTTAWAQYTPAFSSVAFPRTEVLGPVCNLVANAGGAVLPTRATIRGLRVDPSGVVEFATGSQRDTAAFNLYGTDDRRGRGDLVPLNASPIPATVPNSLTPVLYRAETGPIVHPFLLIEEIDGRGRRRLMGPFAAFDERLRAALERIERALDEAGSPRTSARFLTGARAKHLAGKSRAHERPSRPPGDLGIKIEVSRTGPVEVSLAELQAQGLPPRTPPSRLRLTSQGQEVAFQVVEDEAGAPRAIAFRSEELSTTYTGRNVYVLSWRGPLPRMSVVLSRSEHPKDPGLVRVEKNFIYLAGAPEDTDPWLWDLLFGDGSAWPPPDWIEGGTFDLPDLRTGAEGEVEVRIRFLGRTTHRHTVEASINGVFVGSLTFVGAVPAVLSGRLPAEVLRPFGNQLSLSYAASGVEPGDLGLIYLNHLDLEAPVDPPSAPVEVHSLAPFQPGLPHLPGADYLIVTHSLFRGQAERIASLKAAAGHHPAVVDVEQAYDRFSAGIVEANAVQALIREAARHGRLRYVLLVGDDTFDTHDYLETGAMSFVPSLLGWDGEFGRIPSENGYADVDGDGSPDVAIGRLPVQTSEEAAALADKIARSSSAGPAPTHVFAVDNQAPGDVSFRAAAEEVAARLPAGSTVVWADVGEGVEPARETLLGSLRQGVSVLHHFGHGGPEVWADEGLLTMEDVAGLADTGGGTVLLAWACESQWYQNLFGPAINEALVLVPNGGAVASFGPVGITDPALQRELYLRVYTGLERGLTLGEAIRRAKAAALSADPRTRPVVEGFGLLGDPALRAPGGTSGGP